MDTIQICFSLYNIMGVSIMCVFQLWTAAGKCCVTCEAHSECVDMDTTGVVVSSSVLSM